MTTSLPRYFLILTVLIFLGLVALLLSSFLTPLVLAAILAATSYRWYQKILARLSGKKNLAALIMLFLIVLLIITPLISILTVLSNEALNLFIRAQEQIDLGNSPGTAVLQKIAPRLNIDGQEFLQKIIVPALKNFGLSISKQFGAILSDFFQLALGFFIMLITIFYLLRDGQTLGQFLIKISPLKTGDELHIFQTFKEVGRAVFYGNFISALTQGFFGGLGFLLFGLGSPVLWGTTMGFLALIPFLGPYLIFIPATIYLFMVGKSGSAIGFLLYNILVVSSVDNVIKPKFISGEIKIHPLLILLSIVGGLKIFGISGIIYGPLIVAIFLTLIDIYLEKIKNRLE